MKSNERVGRENKIKVTSIKLNSAYDALDPSAEIEIQRSKFVKMFRFMARAIKSNFALR